MPGTWEPRIRLLTQPFSWKTCYRCPLGFWSRLRCLPYRVAKRFQSANRTLVTPIKDSTLIVSNGRLRNLQIIFALADSPWEVKPSSIYPFYYPVLSMVEVRGIEPRSLRHPSFCFNLSVYDYSSSVANGTGEPSGTRTRNLRLKRPPL